MPNATRGRLGGMSPFPSALLYPAPSAADQSCTLESRRPTNLGARRTASYAEAVPSAGSQRGPTIRSSN